MNAASHTLSSNLQGHVNILAVAILMLPAPKLAREARAVLGQEGYTTAVRTIQLITIAIHTKALIVSGHRS